MTMSTKIEKGERGPRMVVAGEWSATLLRQFDEWGCVELELNYAKGWKGTDISFLPMLGQKPVLCLEIIDWNLDDISPVMSLSSLRRLQLSIYAKTKINFSSFPALEEASLEWNVDHPTLFKHGKIVKVFLNRYSGKDLSKFSPMRQLRSLSLASPKIEVLEGAVLPHLEALGVYGAKKLKGLGGLRNFPSLRRLELDGSKGVSDLEALSHVPQLQRLSLSNCGPIETLRPASHFSGLQELLFTGTTNILDGNLDEIAKLPLTHVAFQDREHYSRTLRDFMQRPSTPTRRA